MHDFVKTARGIVNRLPGEMMDLSDAKAIEIFAHRTLIGDLKGLMAESESDDSDDDNKDEEENTDEEYSNQELGSATATTPTTSSAAVAAPTATTAEAEY